MASRPVGSGLRSRGSARAASGRGGMRPSRPTSAAPPPSRSVASSASRRTRTAAASASSRPSSSRAPPTAGAGGVRGTSSRAGTRAGQNAVGSEQDYLRLNSELEQRTADIVRRAEAAIQQHLSMTDDDDGTEQFGDTDTGAGVSDIERYFSTDYGEATADEGGSSARSTGYRNAPSTPPQQTQQQAPQRQRQRQGQAGTSSYETPTESSAIELPPSLLKHFRDFDVTSSTSSQDSRAKANRPVTHAGRPTTSATRRSNSRNAQQSAVGPHRSASRRPRTAGALSRSVASVGGEEFTRGDPLLQAVDAGELGDEAAVRVLKAKLKVTMEQMDAATEELKAVKNELQSLKSQHKDTSKEATREKKSAQAAQRSANQMKKLLEDMTQKYEREKERAKDLQAEVDAMKRKAKQESAGNQGLEVRLNRALEERDNLKLQLQKLKDRPAQSSDADVKALEDELKQLRKQRNEVLEAFEKSLRLVDVLKRQKVHLEAARALTFTEEEFVQALDWRQLE